MLLLSTVMLISASFAGLVSLFDSTPSVAEKPTIAASNVPVRVIVPFVPNTNPRER